MCSHVELVRRTGVNVYLPPREQICQAAGTNLHNLTVMKQMTVGDGVSISVTCLLATFPLLYGLEGRPWDKYIHANRGSINASTEPVEWGPDVELDDMTGKRVVKIVLAMMFYLVKRPQQNPMQQVNKRFNALHATLFPNIQAPTIDPDPALDLRECTKWLSSEELDVKILNILLFIDDSNLPGPTSRAFVTQLQLISSFADDTVYNNQISYK